MSAGGVLGVGDKPPTVWELVVVRRRCNHDAVKINHQVVVFDAADLSAESKFWAGVFGGTVDAEDE